MTQKKSSEPMDPFFQELRERCLADAVLEISEMESQLLRLSSDPLETLRELMKITHSLKGNMQAVGLNACGGLLHQFESAVLATSDKIRVAEGITDSDAAVLEFLLSDAMGGIGSHVHWIRSSGDDSEEKAASRVPALTVLLNWELAAGAEPLVSESGLESVLQESGLEPETLAEPPAFEPSPEPPAFEPPVNHGTSSPLLLVWTNLALPAPQALLALPAPPALFLLPAPVGSGALPQASPAKMDLLEGLNTEEESVVTEGEILALRSEYESVTLLEDSEIGLESPPPVSEADTFGESFESAAFSEAAAPSIAPEPAPIPESPKPNLRLLPQPSGSTPESGLFLLFQNDQRDYAIPIHYVREIVRTQPWTPLPSSRADVLGIVSIHGQVVPILDLSSVIGKRSPEKEKYLMICRKNQQVFGFPVENAEQVVWLEKSHFQGFEGLESQIRSEVVRGVAVQEGRMVLVLDLDPKSSEESRAAA